MFSSIFMLCPQADEPSPELEALTECGPMQPEPGFKGRFKR